MTTLSQRREMTLHRIGVLFIQSQTYFGADSEIQAAITKGLDRDVFDVHVATNCPDHSCHCAPVDALALLPDLHIRRVHFPPSANARARGEVLRQGVLEMTASLGSIAGLVRYARRNRIRIVHCTEKPRDVLTGYLVARAVGARLVIHVHVKMEEWISGAVRRVMRHADALVGVSAFVGQSIVELGYDPSRTHTVLNGMDVSTWTAPSGGHRVREEFGVAPDVPLLCTVARIFKWKGHEHLIRALAEILPECPSARLLVVGEDDPRAHPGGGSYTSELRQLTHRLGMDENVTFTGFRTDIAEFMAACDIYAMPSFEEPFGMVYLEAMAMSKPVVALDSGGVPEVVSHGETGLLSDPGDHAALVENLRHLLLEPRLRSRMGAAGRSRALQHFTHLRMVEDAEALYRHLLGQPPATVLDPVTRSLDPVSG